LSNADIQLFKDDNDFAKCRNAAWGGYLSNPAWLLTIFITGLLANPPGPDFFS